MSLQAVEAETTPSFVTTGDTLSRLAHMEESLEFNQELPFLVVTHEHPDLDAALGVWYVDKFVAPNGAEIRFVSSGTRLPPAETIGFNVIHVDTGHGRFDHHDSVGKTSSFELLAEHFGTAQEPGIAELIALANATDNVEKAKVDPCSVHYVFKGMRGTIKGEDGRSPDWNKILHIAFVMFDSLYSHHQSVAAGDELFKREGLLEDVGGVKLFVNLFKPQIKPESSFRAGGDVAIWYYKKKSTPFVGIQLKKQDEKANERLRLGVVCGALRLAEAQQRNLPITQEELVRMGNLRNHPTWFIHQSNSLVLAGSNTHHPGEAATTLSPQLIAHIVRVALANPAMRFSEIVRKARQNNRTERDRNSQANKA